MQWRCAGMRTSRTVPEMTTDAEAEALLERGLSGLDFRAFRPERFEFARKDATVNMRMPSALLDAIKARAAARGIPYQRWMREALERELGGKEGAA
jgi:predicted DNA binding CopG/RHH family protein